MSVQGSAGDTPPIRLPFRVTALSARKAQRFDLRPDPAMLQALAAWLDITAVRSLRFHGEIRATGRHDFMLEGTLSARVEQACGITLAPVVTDIDEPVIRRYVGDIPEPVGDEAEMPEDDTMEPVPEVIDAGAVAAEALVLALPPFPRAPGAALDRADFAPPGVVPLGDADLKPFAGLAGILSGARKTGADEAG